MGRRKNSARWCAIVGLSVAGVWGLGCASILGADDYKVDPQGGATGGGGGAGRDAGSDTGAACLADGINCTTFPSSCCSGVCSHPLADLMAPSFCAAICTTNSDCRSGCCAPLSNDPRMSCAARGFCPDTCSFDGESCDTTDDCCADETCVDNNVIVVCRDNCMTNADCPSGCCAQLNLSTIKVCSAPNFCP
jgi:hypothetical protein